MEFGYTIPLQKHLKMVLPSSKPTIAPFFCWAIHILTIQHRKAVLAMNYSTRYCILLYGVRAADWVHLPGLLKNEIRAAILREGLSLKLSTANGTNLIAGLNWAMQTLLQQLSLLDKSRFSQPQVTHIMNDEVYYASEFSKSGTPREFFLEEFRCL